MDLFELVPRPRFELGCLAAPVPETGASANSATWGDSLDVLDGPLSTGLRGIWDLGSRLPERGVSGLWEMGPKPFASFFAFFP
jgi:hypothetical protein